MRLASLQRMMVVGMLLAGLIWIIWTRNDSPAWRWLGLLAIVMGHSVLLAIEFGIVYWVNRRDPAPHSGVWKLFRAWLSESLRAPRVFFWQHPFRWNAIPDNLVVDAATPRRGVVFVHGFVCNRGFWNPWFAQPEMKGRPFVAVNLEPVFGSIDDYASIIDGAVELVTRATGMPPILICHSMGGLAARAWLRDYKASQRVHRIVTLGTPHQGTWLSRVSRAKNGRQMALTSPWIKALEQQEADERYAKFICYYSNCDNIVFPTSVATLPGAENRFVEGIAHVAMAFDPVIMRECLAMLD